MGDHTALWGMRSSKHLRNCGEEKSEILLLRPGRAWSGKTEAEKKAEARPAFLLWCSLRAPGLAAFSWEGNVGIPPHFRLEFLEPVLVPKAV